MKIIKKEITDKESNHRWRLCIFVSLLTTLSNNIYDKFGYIGSVCVFTIICCILYLGVERGQDEIVFFSKKEICKACYGKKYSSVYSGGVGGYTDFGPIKYISVKGPGIENITCKRCNGLGYIIL